MLHICRVDSGIISINFLKIMLEWFDIHESSVENTSNTILYIILALNASCTVQGSVFTIENAYN